MTKLFIMFIAMVLFFQMGLGIYFENQGCIEKTLDGFECKKCAGGFNLDQGICRINDFNHTVRSDHQYYRVYVGEEIVTAAISDPIMNRVIKAIKEHQEYQPSITMVRQRSQVSSRTNYRVMCENSLKKIDFFVFYFHKADAITIVGVNSTNIDSTAVTNARLLSIVGNNWSGVLASMIDRKIATPGNSKLVSAVQKGREVLKSSVPKIVFSNPSVVRGKKSPSIILNICSIILKHKNMIQAKLMTHKWSKYRKSWENQIKILSNKHLQCLQNTPTPTPTPTSTPTNTPTPEVTSTDVGTPTSVTEYTNTIENQGSVTIGEEDIYKTQNNLSPIYFTDDIRMVVQLFSMQQQADLSNSIIYIEFRSDGAVDEYALTSRFRANDTVRFYALRIVASNEFLFMGKQLFPSTFDPSIEANKFLQPILPLVYSTEKNELFSSLSQYITAANNTHFDTTKLQIAQRTYPNGSYYLTSIHIDNDVDAVSYVVRLNGGTFMNIKYEETKIVSSSTIPPETAVSLYASSSCCSTLEQKQDACVSYLKQYYGTVPYLSQAQLLYTQNQALPSGVSFDFYLEYADALVTIGYMATVARFNDGSYTILMFDQA